MMTTHDDAMTRGWHVGQMPDMLSLVSGQGVVREGMPKSDDPSLHLVIRFNPYTVCGGLWCVVQWTAVTFSESKNS